MKTTLLLGLILASLFVGSARANPVNTAVPWIEGYPVAGASLLAHPGTWTYEGSISFSIRWYKNGSTTLLGSWGYNIQNGDVGQKVCFEITATDLTGSIKTYVCTWTYVSWPAPVNLVAPKIIGEAAVGSTLTANVGEWHILGPVAPEFHTYWHINGCQECELTEGRTYTVPPGGAGKFVSMFVNPSIPDGGGGTAQGYASAEALEIPASVKPSPAPSGGGSVIPALPPPSPSVSPPSLSTNPTEARRAVLRIGEFRRSPLARTGEQFSYAATVFKDDVQVTSGGVKCSAKVKTVYVRTRGKSFRQGIARCVWRVPDWAIRQFFIGRITFESEDLTLTRQFFVRVR